MRSKFALLSSFNRISAASSEEPTNPLAQKTKVTCAVQILFLWISISFNKPTLAELNGLRSTCNISVDARTCAKQFSQTTSEESNDTAAGGMTNNANETGD